MSSIEGVCVYARVCKEAQVHKRKCMILIHEHSNVDRL
jgi:hypothetical protein